MRTSFLGPSALLFCACGGAPAGPAPSEPSGTAGTATEAPAPGDPTEAPGTPGTSYTGGSGTAPFEIHEWALLDVLADGTAELAAGPGHPPPTLSVRKPVVYVHLADGVDEASFSLEARMASGSILEHWPPGALEGGRVSWSATARRAHCDTVVAPAARGRWATPPDGVTELPDLPTYDAASAACLTVGDTASGLLFYRGTMGAPSLPLSVTRGTDGLVTVTATGDTTGLPGEILRVSTGLSGPWPMGYVVVSRAAVPARGASATLAVGTTAAEPAAEGARLVEAMLALGLAHDEADAFVRAWSEGLFGTGATAADASRELRDARLPAVPGPPQDSILFWLPTPAVDAVATLTIDPVPGVVRRAFLVRVELPATATAGPAPAGS